MLFLVVDSADLAIRSILGRTDTGFLRLIVADHQASQDEWQKPAVLSYPQRPSQQGCARGADRPSETQQGPFLLLEQNFIACSSLLMALLCCCGTGRELPDKRTGSVECGFRFDRVAACRGLLVRLMTHARTHHEGSIYVPRSSLIWPAA